MDRGRASGAPAPPGGGWLRRTRSDAAGPEARGGAHGAADHADPGFGPVSGQVNTGMAQTDPLAHSVRESKHKSTTSTPHETSRVLVWTAVWTAGERTARCRREAHEKE